MQGIPSLPLQQAGNRGPGAAGRSPQGSWTMGNSASPRMTRMVCHPDILLLLHSCPSCCEIASLPMPPGTTRVWIMKLQKLFSG